MIPISSNRIDLIALDFDNTVIEGGWPDLPLGREVPGAVEWLKKIRTMGIRIILFTLRRNEPGSLLLLEAIQWLADRGIEAEPPVVDECGKVDADLFIDDRAFGCPLIMGDNVPVVDWSVVGPRVMEYARGKA